MCDRHLSAVPSVLLALFVGGVILPAQAQDISVTVPEVEPTPGQTVTLSIEADLRSEQVESYNNMEFKFDPAVLNVRKDGVRDGDELSFGDSNFLVSKPKSGTLRVSNISKSLVSGEGVFLKIDVTLTTDADITNPGTPFRLSPSSLGTPENQAISVFVDGNGNELEVNTINQGKVGDLEIQKARNEGIPNTATVRGTVTRAFGEYIRLEDSTGTANSPSGLTVGPVSGDLKQDIGNSITQGIRLYIRGTLSEPNGLLRIDGSDVSKHFDLGQGSLPAPQMVSLSTLETNGEEYESELVQVSGLSFQNPSGSFSANTTYTVADATTSLAYRVEGGNQTELIGKSIPTGTFTYTGVVGESGSGSQLVPVRASTALPVTLTGFTAVRNGSSTVLTWQTASETNNAGFRVQYERAAGWEALGFVPSKASDGSTSRAQSYRFVVDRRLGPGTHRFRLEQVDLDRSTALSDTVQVEIGMEGALHLSAPAPNPAAERATLSFAVQEGTKAEVTMYDVLGQRVRTLYEGTPPGEEARRVTVETGTLSSGVYVVRLRAGGRTQTRRLTVVQ